MEGLANEARVRPITKHHVDGMCIHTPYFGSRHSFRCCVGRYSLISRLENEANIACSGHFGQKHNGRKQIKNDQVFARCTRLVLPPLYFMIKHVVKYEFTEYQCLELLKNL